jgi:hypothetical protein
MIFVFDDAFHANQRSRRDLDTLLKERACEVSLSTESSRLKCSGVASIGSPYTKSEQCEARDIIISRGFTETCANNEPTEAQKHTSIQFSAHSGSPIAAPPLHAGP